MNIDEHLNDQITKYNAYVISDDDQKQIDVNLPQFIINKLTLKKFRKHSVDPSTFQAMLDTIKLCIENDHPIKITIFFGGYKHFWNPSAPQIDWAEVFSLRFLTDWLAPVCASYKHGVVLEFLSEDWILNRMDNYSVESLDEYSKSFTNILDKVKSGLPSNFVINYKRLGDLFDKQKMLDRIYEMVPAGYDRWNKLSDDEKAVELNRSRRSVILNDGEGEDRLIESRMIELAYYDVEALPDFVGSIYDDKENIFVAFTFGLSNDNIGNWLVLGSTYASVVDYWVGRGILQVSNGKFTNRIVSNHQYEQIKDKLIVKNIDVKGLEGLKNLGSIEYVDGDIIF